MDLGAIGTAIIGQGAVEAERTREAGQPHADTPARVAHRRTPVVVVRRAAARTLRGLAARVDVAPAPRSVRA